ncbi:hypothetical protein CJ030_MR4G023617 [Morella rubra]|uniref:PAP/OAS1 substrate-binding-related domain-containing protein n=1 Tax=Morella rubra TaxID=262757 RepID=A0A6A1VTG7_9ROSI|nr:hypothetical protein CJ030_MR4G023617 [Morella rubra]
MAVSWLLRGPVCKSFLPDIKAEVPENGGEDLLLSEEFLRTCVGIFSLSPTALATNSRPFAQKHLNIIDPLRENNNLGRSVNRGNFYRIRSALKHGARKLGCILLLPVERIADELNMFFSSTPGRHGNIWNDKELATTGNLDVRKTNALSDCLPLKSNLGTLVLEYAEHATHFNMSGLFRKNGKIENWKPCLKMPAKAVTTNEIHSALLPVGRKHLVGSNLVSCCINQNGVASTCSVVSGSAAKISPPNGEKYTS